MREVFSKPAAGGIVEKLIDGVDHILIQERYKEDAQMEQGLIEIPAGKIREFENVYECLKREIREETGLEVIEIEGEKDAMIFQSNGYKVLNYSPFACSQNIEGIYPIMVEIFICKAKGEVLLETNETKNIRWISLEELKGLLDENSDDFYPMHVITLKKYLKMKLENYNNKTE
ncbi:MAG: NUDIX domain-containing protein [Anaeromicrobium sp.]|jgi:8-oxo-dGTP pyrophosphatase MutT (NUDIX family)|uniref:NUDIX hydrolase n=1 Tax=Anaeromicrobium sp. TaxID=1929132 RepID=UPI0025F098E3|nr:NUDIX domain-containing protein [Anaeromicrobium sp.]MCT4593094.1 NUDIX domain-containing protein [Anaeromicrobium sp.]